MRRSVEHTLPSDVRDERYRRLARHCAQRCHDLTKALQFLEQSLETNPIAIEPISLLDAIYTRLARTDALRALYERALEHLPAEHTTELRAQWQARLRKLTRNACERPNTKAQKHKRRQINKTLMPSSTCSVRKIWRLTTRCRFCVGAQAVPRCAREHQYPLPAHPQPLEQRVVHAET